MQLLLLAWLCSPSLGSKTLNITDTSEVWCGCGDRVVTCYPRLQDTLHGRSQQLQCPGQTCERCSAMFANCNNKLYLPAALVMLAYPQVVE